MEQTVRLLGELGERYGAEHTYYNLRTPAEAIKLLCINHPELQEELVHAHEQGIGYQLVQAGAELDYSDLQLPLGSNDLILTPVISGSGGGTGKILAGVGLVAFSILTAGVGSGFLGLGAGLTGAVGPFAGGLTSGFILGSAASVAIGSIGTALILGGVTEMLSRQASLPLNGSAGIGTFGTGGGGGRFAGNTKTDGFQTDIRGTDGVQSYAYTGAANTVGVGATIPVVYGKALVGSHLLSANVEITDESDPLRVPSGTKDSVTAANEVRLGGELLQFGRFTQTSGVEAKRTNNYKGAQWGYFPTLKMVRNDSITIPDAFTNDSTKTGADVVLVLRKGLFDYVAGEGTTVVEGAITYQVQVEDAGTGTALGSSTATIQGQLLPGQEYYWIQRTVYAQPAGVGNLRMRVVILDFKCRATCELQVLSVGYDR